MTEPKRWLDDCAPEAIDRMLRAAGEEQPTPVALQRTLTAIAAGAVVTGTVGAATGAVATSKGALLAGGIFAKWTLLGAAVTLGAGGVVFAVSAANEPHGASIAGSAASAVATGASSALPLADPRRAEPNPPAVATEHVAAAEAPIAEASPPTGAAQPSALGQLKPHTEPAVEPLPFDAEVLARETKLIDQARAQLAAGRAAAALASLDEYQAGFAQPRFGPEALYLRMEASLSLGNRHAARKIAARLASTYPNSPHAARAEAVLAKKVP